MVRLWFGRYPPRRSSLRPNHAEAANASYSTAQEPGAADGSPSSSCSTTTYFLRAVPLSPAYGERPSTWPVQEPLDMDEDERGESPPVDKIMWMDDEWWRAYKRNARRAAAIEAAPTYARYRSEDKNDELEDPMSKAELEHVESAGPFSAAMEIIQRRVDTMRSSPERDIVQWKPSYQQRLRTAPSLLILCLMTLRKHGEEIESLEGIPDDLKHKIVKLLCSSRKMNARILETCLNGSTTEVKLSDCSWASEEVLQNALANCSIDRLEVLQLDLCGRCMSTYVLQTALAKSQTGFTSLMRLSLKGAYRLTDNALSLLASSAPSLRSIDLGKCSLITSCGIISLAEKLNLEELYIDYCMRIDVMQILPMLEKLTHLEVLSVSGVPTVSNDFVLRMMLARGYKMRVLVFACCQKLTTRSISAIASNCSQLRILNIQDLRCLNDSALKYLASGCRSMTSLKLRQSRFSDESIAAFLEVSGDSLIELSLNNVAKVAHQTAIAISLKCRLNLQYLDLSFCRQLTDEELGFIVDTCSRLRVLKLFGCSQVTKEFNQWHRNPEVEIIGLEQVILDELVIL
ncbi:F-box/LRR-repeat protein 14 [Canna indica]|uniref:F-box/LRR-repeat protein 14 n=1 Tax=Canna indica TaxID=4628 RepID=A0AAQ3KIU1_9LILI|nr:F-box/LRR-repeat protein 14 [Canna indica]